jgi:hypothetical protein
MTGKKTRVHAGLPATALVHEHLTFGNHEFMNYAVHEFMKNAVSA